MDVLEQRQVEKILLDGPAALAARGRLLAVGEREEQRPPPAALGVLRQARLGHGHGEEPPALLGAQRRPLAADDGNLLLGRRLRGPGEHAELLAEQPVHQVGAGVPAAGEDLGGLESVVELAAGDVGDGRPDRTR